MASSATKAAPRLTAESWIEAGFELIASDGIRAVKVDRLCERLGVTKGSFYWHFEDIAAYFAALADAWGQAQREGRRSLQSLGELDPEERLVAMMRHLTSRRQWMLERAAREWGRWDAGVAAQVAASDRWVLKEVQRAFLDAGFPPEEAKVRARASFAAGVGFIHLAHTAPRPGDGRDHDRFLELMLRP
jgi:AcrR family transcriptional regulator